MNFEFISIGWYNGGPFISLLGLVSDEEINNTDIDGEGPNRCLFALNISLFPLGISMNCGFGYLQLCYFSKKYEEQYNLKYGDDNEENKSSTSDRP